MILEKHVNEVQKRLFWGINREIHQKASIQMKWQNSSRNNSSNLYKITCKRPCNCIMLYQIWFSKVRKWFSFCKTHFRNLGNTILIPEFHFQEVGYENLDTKREFWRFGSIISSSFCSCDCTLYHQPCNDSSNKSDPHLPWCHECGQKP